MVCGNKIILISLLFIFIILSFHHLVFELMNDRNVIRRLVLYIAVVVHIYCKMTPTDWEKGYSFLLWIL